MRRISIIVTIWLLLSGFWPKAVQRDHLAASSERYREILAELAGVRPIEGRIAGLTTHRACTRRPAGGDSLVEADCLDARLLPRRLFAPPGRGSQGGPERAGEADIETPDALHAAALLELARHEHGSSLARAVELLRAAVEADPENPARRSDLAAALLVEAQRHDRPLALVEALQHIEHAAAILGEASSVAAEASPVIATVAFNRALIRQEMGLVEAASKAWGEFLALDSFSPWADEAQARLAEMEAARSSAGAREAPPHARLDDLLGRLEGEAPERLVLLRALANDIARLSSDRLALESIAALEDAMRRGRLGELARGHRDFAKGYAAYRRGALDTAETHLEAARAALEESPYHFWTELYRACVSQRRDQHRASLERLASLRREIDGRSYSRLEGYLGWMQGLGHLQLGRPLSALPFYERALAGFERARDVDGHAAIHALLGEIYLELGRQENGWRELYRALRLVPSIQDPSRAVLVHSALVNAQLDFDRPRLGLLFHEPFLRLAERAGRPKGLLSALLSRADLELRLGQARDALPYLERAAQIAETLDDPDMTTRANADLSILEAALVEGDPARRASDLDKALAHDAANDERTAGVQAAHEQRAELHLELGERAAAAERWQASLHIFEKRLAERSPDQGSEPSHLHRGARRLYERLIAYHLDEEEIEKAFTLAERARQFSLRSLDFLATEARERRAGRRLAALRARLAPGVTLVHFALLEDEIVTFRVSREGASVERVEVSRRELETLIRDVASASRHAQSEAPELSRRLSAVLVPALTKSVDPEHPLVIVPDGALFNVPFGALLLADGRFLATARAYSIAPSVASHLTSRRRAAEREPVGEVLVLSDPAFDHEQWPELGGRLLASREEGARIAALHGPESAHHVGEAATREAFLERAGSAGLIHFGGHAVANPRHPGLSLLLLATSLEDSGAFFQQEIYGLDLRAAPLVVLSACDSGALTGIEGESVSSLARAFLSAGASAVVASLWPVNDESTAFLMEKLHLGLRDGLPPSAALRAAQQAYLENLELVRVDPHGWAAFQVIGAGF